MKKNFIAFLLMLLMCFAMCIPAIAAESERPPRLYDGADLLTKNEEEKIAKRLDSVSEEYEVDFVVATVETVEGLFATGYAKEYYKEGGFGDGVMLFITMEDEDGDRAYRLYVKGFAETAITEDEQLSIDENIADHLKDEDYVSAVNTFIDECEYQINGEINGFPFDVVTNLIIALIIGIVTALIVTGVWRSQLRSVRQQAGAAGYTKENSMRITSSSDFFLYRTVSRVKRVNTSSSGGRGSSSGGRMSGGKF